MSQQRKNISASLRRTHVAIHNTMEIPAILDIVSQYGYSLEQMELGTSLYETAKAAVNARTIAVGNQSGARKRLKTAGKAATGAYQKFSEIAKAIYRGDRSRLIALGLDGPMPRTTAPFLTAAFHLFDNASSAASLSEFGYSEDSLAAEREKIVAYQNAANEYQQAIGAAQLATQHQNAAVDAMIRWTDQYLRIARAVLKEDRQFLEVMRS